LNLELITTEEYKLLDAYGESEIKNFAGIKVGRSVVVNVPPMHQ
jgi:hypothetical protein